MDQTLRLPFKPFQLNAYWITAAILLFVLIVFRYISDPVLIFILAFSIGIFPLLIGNRLLLMYLTFLSFFMAQSYYLSIFTNLTSFRWFFLGVSVFVAITYPMLSKIKIRKTWKENWWVWVFSAFAIGSTLYSMNPLLTILRTFTLMCVFFFMSRFIKPMAEIYGVSRIIGLMLYAILPLFLYSLTLLGSPEGYNVYENTYETLMRKSLSQRLGMANTAGDFDRFHGIFQNPNSLGLTTALLFPLALSKVLTERKNRVLQFLLLIMTVLLLMSGSRLGIIATLVSSLYVLVRFFGQRVGKWIAGAVFVLAVIFSVMWISNNGDKVLSYFRFDKRNVLLAGGRVEAWLVAKNFIVERPLLGYGFGTEDQLLFNQGYRFMYHEGAYLHSSYLGLLAQVGILGTALFLIPVFWLLATELRARSPSALRIGLQGMLIAGLIACFFESWIYSAGNAQVLPFWSGIALLEFLRDKEKK